MAKYFDVIAITLFVTLSVTSLSLAVDRDYYLAINEIVWDYAPTGLNHVTGSSLEDDEILSVIGTKYRKAVYRRFTDDSYSREIPHDPSLGFLGPTLKAEVGDRILIHLFNNATLRPYSVHPHGVFYRKADEGAPYGENIRTFPGNHVPPGGSHTYTWEVRPEYGPKSGDTDCLAWAYHSHTNSQRDISSGLIGALIICKPDRHNEEGELLGVDHEFVALFMSVQEFESWYFEETLEMFVPEFTNNRDSEFYGEFAVLNSINGFIYGNVPGFNSCGGDVVVWYLLAMGGEGDLHPIHFQGQTIIHDGHRKDTLILIPATFTTVTMETDNPGRWLLGCQLYDHGSEGMSAILNVEICHEHFTFSGLNGRVRQYFIQAEEVIWDYAPTGVNQLTGEDITTPGTDSAVFFEHGANRIGGRYKKARYRGYTDGTFTEPVPEDPTLGILGPVVSGEVGDTIRVTFRNNGSHPFNVEPHGVYFSEVEAVEPGSEHTYTWTIPSTVAPTFFDPNCLTYLYFSSVDYTRDQLAGLIGPMLVCKEETYDAEMRLRNIFLLLTVFNENRSWFFQENLDIFVPDQSGLDVADEDFEESNIMHAINGKMYGNLFGIKMCVRKKTRFRTLSVGTDTDMHALRFDGIAAVVDGVNTGVVDLFPHTSHTITATPIFAGKGRISCRLDDHILGGMATFYQAVDCSVNNNKNDDITTRQYYIAAEEVIWDYGEIISDEFHPDENIENSGTTIGSRYKKALYFQYTDETFTKKVPKPLNLGFLGPVIKGEVGDRIKILFKNSATRPYNIFPWGAIDPRSLKESDVGVEPGATREYEWFIPDEAGPADDQPACQSFVYISVVDRVTDPVAGLIGPLLVCAKGGLNLQEIDAEFYLLFYISDENLSPYLDENIQQFIGIDPADFEATPEFEKDNKKHAINGHLSQVPGLIMYKKWLVRWHLIGWGSEVDFHSIHFHAHTFVHVSSRTHRGDVFNVYPGFVGTVDMETSVPGEWLLHCHVFDHMTNGMQTTYTVLRNELHKRCRIEDVTSSTLRCDHVTKRKNLNPNNYFLRVLSNGTKVDISTRGIQKLDLSYSSISRNFRKIIRYYPNLVSLNLRGNDLVIIGEETFSYTPLLVTLILRENPISLLVSEFNVDYKGRIYFDLPRSTECPEGAFMSFSSYLDCHA